MASKRLAEMVLKSKEMMAQSMRSQVMLGRRRVVEDIVLPGEAVEDEEDVATPLREVGGLKVQNDGNKISDVLDGSDLVVEPGNGHGVGGEGVVVIVPRAGVTVTTPESGGPLFQGVGLHALLVKGVDGGVEAILGGSARLEEVGVLLELLVALGIGRVQGGSFVFQ
jgi:hypothetical protein